MFSPAKGQPRYGRCCVHCFTGESSVLRGYVERGYYIGVTGFVGMAQRGAALRAALAEIPLDRLMLETDASAGEVR